MFNYYDDSKKEYEIIHHDGTTESLTAQELYEFYILNEHGLNDAFDYTKRRLDSGETVVADDNVYDWNLSSSIYKGRLLFKKANFTQKVPPKINTTSSGCSHSNKYINEAGGIKFCFCKSCKSDLGDA